jgi:hypothetical protein
MPIWQFSFCSWLSCHSWQARRKRSVSAMLMMIALVALSVLAVASTIVALTKDGYRRTPTDWTRLP